MADYNREIEYGLELLRSEDGEVLPPLDVSQLSDDQLDKLAGTACCGIPWEAFSDAELESLVDGNYEVIEQVRARERKKVAR